MDFHVTVSPAEGSPRSDCPQAYYHLGLLLANWPDKANLTAACEAFKKALEYKPDFADAHAHFAVALAALDKPEEAVAEFRTAVKLNPNYHEAYVGLGIELKHEGLADDAIRAFRTAIALRPNDANAHFELGLLLSEQRKVDTAIIELSEAVRLNTVSEKAHYTLASISTVLEIANATSNPLPHNPSQYI